MAIYVTGAALLFLLGVFTLESSTWLGTGLIVAAGLVLAFWFFTQRDRSEPRDIR